MIRKSILLLPLLLLLTSCLALQPAAGGSTTAGTSQNADQGLGNLGNILGNIISSVTGSATTTQATLIGSWSYTEPAVQFESESLLSQAGGGAAAAKVESQLVPIYRMAGLEAGKVQFTFTRDGKVTYTIGSRSNTGTYTFNAEKKTVQLTTANGRTLTAYVTVSGNQMSLTFDSTKAMEFVGAISSKASSTSTLGAIGKLIGNYKGMKTGFKFARS